VVTAEISPTASLPSMAPVTHASPDAMPTVLMGFADALAAIETAWSLQAAGYRVIAFQRAGQRPVLRRLRGVELYDVPAPERDARGTVDAVRSLLQTLQPAALLALDDHSLWVCGQLRDTGVPIAGPSGLAIDCALDKSLQVSIAERVGVPTPPTQVLDDPRDAGPIESAVIVKAAYPVCESRGILVRPTAVVCANDAELARAATKSWYGPVLVQPLISGVGEGLFGHRGQHGVTGWTSHRRVRMVNPQGSASSACRSSAVDERLLEPCSKFLEEIGWTGMFMLEFLRDRDGAPWFMELNGRAWGSMALARRRGFEYPAWTVGASLEPDFEAAVPQSPPDVVCRHLGLDLVHLLFVARGPQSDAEMEWPRLGRSVRDVFGRQPGSHFYNWDRSQPHVLVTDTVRTLGDYARKIFKGKS
jgi:hypothetical protein